MDTDDTGEGTTVRQDGSAREHGRVLQAGRDLNHGLSGRAVTRLVMGVLSVFLGGLLAFYVVGRTESKGAAGPTAPAPPSEYTWAAGKGTGIEATLSMRESGLVQVSKYLPTAREERAYLHDLTKARGTPGWEAFRERQHPVKVEDSFKLSVVNTGGARLRILDIRPSSLDCEPAIDEAFYPPVGGGGGEQVVHAVLDLDRERPRLMAGGRDYFRHYSVPLPPGDAFDIFVQMKIERSFCRFFLDVEYLDPAGKPRTMTVKDPSYGAGWKRSGPVEGPFEISARLPDETRYRRAYEVKDDPLGYVRGGEGRSG